MKSESDKGKPHRKGRPYAVAYLIIWGLVMLLAYVTKVTDGSSLGLNLLVGATIALLSVLPIWAAILVWHLAKAYNKKSVTKAEEPVLEESEAAPIQGNRATQTAYERWKFYKDQEAVEFRAKVKVLDDKMKSTAHLRKEPTQAELDQAEVLLTTAKRIADNLNTTTNPALFFTQYDQLLATLEALAQLEKVVDMEGTPPSVMLAELKTPEKRDAVTYDFLTRYRDNSTLSVFSLRDELKPYWDCIPAEQAAQIEAECKEEEERQRQAEAAKEAKRLEARREGEKRRRQLLLAQKAAQKAAWQSGALHDEATARKTREMRMEENKASAVLDLPPKQAAELPSHLRPLASFSFLDSCTDEQLFDLIADYAKMHVHIKVDNLSIVLPTIGKGRIEGQLAKLESLHIIRKSLDTGTYLCVMQQEEIDEILRSRKNQHTKSEDANVAAKMDGFQFEHYCANLLLRNGFPKAEVTQASGDYGIDIKAEKDGVTYGIQCKYYTDKVGNHAVQEAYSGAQFYHCMVAAVMTNCTFTQHAKETAAANNVLLWDKDKLAEFEAAAQDKRLEDT